MASEPPAADEHVLVAATLKICDLTQFYSPVSGGVKRYLAEKTAYLARVKPMTGTF